MAPATNIIRGRRRAPVAADIETSRSDAESFPPTAMRLYGPDLLDLNHHPWAIVFISILAVCTVVAGVLVLKGL
jgi:hypothetical protein